MSLKRIKRLRAQLAAAVAERDEARATVAAARVEAESAIASARAGGGMARALAEREIAKQAPRPAMLDLARLRRDLEVRRVELHNASARYGAIVNQRGRDQDRAAAGVAAGGVIDEAARRFVALEHELGAAEAVAGNTIGGARPTERGHA